MIVTCYSIEGHWWFEHEKGHNPPGANVVHLVRVPDTSVFHVRMFAETLLELPGIGMHTAAELVALALSRTLSTVSIATTII